MLDSKEIDLDLIKEGFEMFDVENKGKINPIELRQTLEEMNLKEKNKFMYELISSLCENKNIKSKGGITLEEFINYFLLYISDTESKKGIQKIFNTFSDIDNKIPIHSFYQISKEIGDEDNYTEIKRLIEMSKTGGKELNFDEFYDIMKNNKELKKKKYYYQNYTYQNEIKSKKMNHNNRYNSIENSTNNNEFKRYHRKYRGQKSNDYNNINKSDNLDKVYIQFKK